MPMESVRDIEKRQRMANGAANGVRYSMFATQFQCSLFKVRYSMFTTPFANRRAIRRSLRRSPRQSPGRFFPMFTIKVRYPMFAAPFTIRRAIRRNIRCSFSMSPDAFHNMPLKCHPQSIDIKATPTESNPLTLS